MNFKSTNNQEVNKDESIKNIFNHFKSSLKYFISGYVINPQDVDDVCQETFLRTYKSSLEKDIKSPKSFMFRVAKNLIFSDFRKASVQLCEYVENIDIVDPSIELDDLENNVLAQEKLGVMCEAIAALPTKCRQVVIMRKVYGLSTKDIAIRMNINTSTVSNYITRGMCAYNDAVDHYNNEHSNDKENNIPVKSRGSL